MAQEHEPIINEMFGMRPLGTDLTAEVRPNSGLIVVKARQNGGVAVLINNSFVVTYNVEADKGYCTVDRPRIVPVQVEEVGETILYESSEAANDPKMIKRKRIRGRSFPRIATVGGDYLLEFPGFEPPPDELTFTLQSHQRIHTTNLPQNRHPIGVLSARWQPSRVISTGRAASQG